MADYSGGALHIAATANAPLPLHAFDLLQSLFHLVQGQEGFMHDAGPEGCRYESPVGCYLVWTVREIDCGQEWRMQNYCICAYPLHASSHKTTPGRMATDRERQMGHSGDRGS